KEDAGADALRVGGQAPQAVALGEVAGAAELHAEPRPAEAADGHAQVAGDHRRGVGQVAALAAEAVAAPQDLAAGRIVTHHPRRHRADDLVLAVHLRNDRRTPGTHPLAVLVALAVALLRLLGFPDRLARGQVDGSEEDAF